MKLTAVVNFKILFSVIAITGIVLISFAFTNPINPKEKYVFIVGVADYQGVENDLNFSDDDAVLFYNKMRKLGVKKENMILLLDKNATRNNIENKMRNLFLKADENDQVIFYFSGHGSKGYFLPHDYNNLLSHKTVKNIFKQSKAKKKICFADACYSGSIRNKNKSKGVKQTDSYTLKQDINGGVAVIMSSTGYETSLEMGNLGQGVFSYYLLNGLSGKADLNSDKTITIVELYEYTKRNVVRKTNGRQNPIIFGNFNVNMPILKRK